MNLYNIVKKDPAGDTVWTIEADSFDIKDGALALIDRDKEAVIAAFALGSWDAILMMEKLDSK